MAYKASKVISASEVRLKFLDYFKGKGHQFIPSTSVLCGTGHGTYFTNAGMNQFRGIFEADNLPHNHPMANVQQAVNSQRCIRMNDLTDVGRDGYHHTLFEMLGSWTFGLDNKNNSQFNRLAGKKEAINGAWELLTKVYGIDEKRLTVTYFGGDSSLGLKPDLETREIWLQLGLPAEKVVPAGSESNFWTMGEMGGPCGPCTEIHYTTGAPAGGPWPSILELWNIVFISYSRDANGGSRRLPRSHIDTGLGLERLTAVLNGNQSNYGSDIFSTIFKAIQSFYRIPAYEDVYALDNDVNFAYRVIADHVRMASVAIADGVLPSNRDLGHKVRSVLTRAFCQIVTTRKDSLNNLHRSFPALARVVVEQSPLSAAFPELIARLPSITAALEIEAQRFHSAWSGGRKVLNSLMGDPKFESSRGVMNPEFACRLLDGSIPSMSLELLASLTRSYSLKLDVAAVKHLLAKAQSAKKAANVHTKMGADNKMVPADVIDKLRIQKIPPTEDWPQYEYSRLNATSQSLSNYKFPPCESSVLAVYPIEVANTADSSCWVVFDKTNLHPANLGGQASDYGYLEVRGSSSRYPITMVQQVGAFGEAHILHKVEAAPNAITRGSRVKIYVDEERRQAAMRAHTACHLTMAAVRSIAKEQDSSQSFVSGTMQAGSSVEADRFTLDIQTPLQLTDVELISKTQATLNSWVQSNCCHSVQTSVEPVEKTMSDSDIIRLPNEEYPAVVRVVKIGGEVSKELCCGTHVLNTSDISAAVILSATGGRQGVKRLSVVTGPAALAALEEGKKALKLLNSINQTAKSAEITPDSLNAAIRNMASIRRLVDSVTLPRVVRDQIAADLDGLNKSLLAKTTAFVEQVLESSNKVPQAAVVELAWRSLRTETTRSIIRTSAKNLRQKSENVEAPKVSPVIFIDTPIENLTDRPSWVICALPLLPSKKTVWQPILNDFRLRTDDKRDNKWLIADGALPQGSLNDLKSAIERIFVSLQ